MDAFLLICLGLISLAIGISLFNSYRSFEKRAVPVTGLVQKLVRVDAPTKGFGASHIANSALVPMIEYEFGGHFRFIAEEDVRFSGLSEGDEVSLLIDEQKPKIAQFASTEPHSSPIIFSVIGTSLLVLGLFIFDINDMTKHWELMGLAIISLALLSIKLIDQLLPLLAGDLFFENAEEAD